MNADNRRRMLWSLVVGGGVLIVMSFLTSEPGAFWLGSLTGVVLVAALLYATGAFRGDSSG